MDDPDCDVLNIMVNTCEWFGVLEVGGGYFQGRWNTSGPLG